MVGKASLLLVMSFSLLFLVFGHNFNTVSTRTVENLTEYYTQTTSHDLAVSGANLGASAIFFDNSWTAGYNNLSLNDGIINVEVEVNVAENTRKVISTGTYNGKTSRVEVILSPSRFSRYAYYSESEGDNIWWMARDTVFGPFHTQDYLRVNNHPVFGVTGYRTTIRRKIIYYDYYNYYPSQIPQKPSGSTQKTRYKNSVASDKPIFYGSFEDGVDQPLPTEGLDPLRDAAADDGLKIPESHSTTTTNTWVDGHWNYSWSTGWQWIAGHYETSTTTTKDTVYVTFVNDSVKIKMGYNKPTTTYYTPDVAPNGVIYAEGMDIRLQGTVKGQYSVVSDNNIWLDDDVTYFKDPKTYPNSTDLLGIISQNNIYITDNSYTQNIKIHGAMYCEDGGFSAQNYNSRGIDGQINLLGGVTQKTRGPVGTFSGSSISSGFSKSYKYDTRLLKLFPPFFPTTGGFIIVSWKE